MEVAFRKVRVLRALTSLEPAEFARLEAGLEKLLAGQRQERAPRRRSTPAGFWGGRRDQQAAHRQGQALLCTLLLQGLPFAGGHGAVLWLEPAAGLRVDQAPDSAGGHRAGARTALASQKAC